MMKTSCSNFMMKSDDKSNRYYLLQPLEIKPSDQITKHILVQDAEKCDLDHLNRQKANTVNQSYQTEQRNVQQNSKMEKEPWFVKHVCGIFTVAAVYVIFIKIYVLTVYFSLLPGMKQGHGLPWLGFLFFTLFTGMALASHIRVMITDPGALPKGYKQLDEDKLTLKFTKLFDERETLHMGPQVRKLLRQGATSAAQELKDISDKKSIYKKVKKDLASNGSGSSSRGKEDALSVSFKL